MSASSKASTPAFVKALRFSGHQTGLVKTLRGFRKGQHSVPDAITPATIAFLARLCTEELTEQAEAFFQKTRSACAYKRKDLALDLSPPAAVLTARDFSLELSYGFAEADPASYRSELTLSGFTDLAFLRGEACQELFNGRFSRLCFDLVKGTPVESVIDAVEGLPDSTLRVDYPSDCSRCLLSVEGVEAQVHFDGMELSMHFPRSGSPAELLDGFLAVQSAFSLSRSSTLSGLVA